MSSGLALRSDPAPVKACTVSRNVHAFDLLIEDMEAELGEAWGDLTFDEARAFLMQDEAATLEFIAIAVNAGDEEDLGFLGEIITVAKTRSITVILVVDDVSPMALHELLRLGADEFVPYPLAEGALHDALDRARTGAAAPAVAAPAPVAAPAAATAFENTDWVEPGAPAPMRPKLKGEAAIFAVQGLAGGTGASTLAANLAWEFANIDRKESPSVCLMDMDLQAGTLSTYLDLPRRDIVVELLQDATTMDVDAFKQALLNYQSKMSVFNAPPEILPLDIIGQAEMDALLNLAAECFDVIVIDMPHTLVMWTETVMNRADVYFATMELDMRSAQNAMRFIKVMQSEDLPLDKVHFVLNRAPGMTDLTGKGRVKKLAESLGVKIATQLPDGGKQAMQAGDHGEPLSEIAKKNPLRREILKLAEGLHKAMLAEADAK
ncbi:MAG: AAA family ATPase [Rhodobacteraceae bacterium]|nr:AAA family ATPase [Paracoccaceae bacterium]